MAKSSNSYLESCSNTIWFMAYHLISQKFNFTYLLNRFIYYIKIITLLSGKNVCRKFTFFSYSINKYWGITSDSAMMQCSETLLQSYYENCNFRYSTQWTVEKNQDVLKFIFCRYAKKEWKKVIISMNACGKNRKFSHTIWEGMEIKVKGIQADGWWLLQDQPTCMFTQQWYSN